MTTARRQICAILQSLKPKIEPTELTDALNTILHAQERSTAALLQRNKDLSQCLKCAQESLQGFMDGSEDPILNPMAELNLARIERLLK